MRATFGILAAAWFLFGGIGSAMAGTIYFLVGERPGEEIHGDSYVLPLSDPADIAHARALIANGGKGERPIVAAKIAAGANGINRDYRADADPAWSWHVTEFLGFHDTTIEVLDGWPSDVERDVPAWLANTNSQVGFWSYTVVEELPNVPEPGTAGLCLVASVAGLSVAALRRKQQRE